VAFLASTLATSRGLVVAAAEEDAHQAVDEVVVTPRLRATTLTAMHLRQAVVAVADAEAVAAEEVDVAVVALRRDENRSLWWNENF
jgi:hypothetical protein